MQKSRNRRFRNRIDFPLNSASIRGTFSVIFHVFSVYFFGIDFRIDFSLILHGFGGSLGAWFGRAVAWAVQHRTPGGVPDGRDRRSQGRSGWPRVTPGVAFGRPVVQHHEFLCFSMALGLHCSCFLHDFNTSFHTILTIYVSPKIEVSGIVFDSAKKLLVPGVMKKRF